MSEKLLLGPGPSNVYEEVYEIMRKPIVGHLDPEFLEFLENTKNLICDAFCAQNYFAIPISATGSGAMQTIADNFFSSERGVAVAVNGVFGQRICEMGRRLGANVIPIVYPQDHAINPEEFVLTARKNKAGIWVMVHGETSTGISNDVKSVGALKENELFIVDSVTSLGGVELLVKDWNIDVCYSASQKCLSGPPGIAPLVLNERALNFLVQENKSWYFDLRLIFEYINNRERVYHHTAPISMIYALSKCIEILLSKTLKESHKIHREVATYLYEQLSDRGFEIQGEVNERLYPLTAAIVPDHLRDKSAEIRRNLLKGFSVEVGAGLGKDKDRIWRIGLMGKNAKIENVDQLMSALDSLTK